MPDDALAVDTLTRASAVGDGRLAVRSVTADDWRSMLERADVVVLLAESAGQSVGVVAAVRTVHLRSGRDLLTVDDLFVAPIWRGRGLGRTLMTAVATLAGDGLVTWQLDEGDLAAQRFSLGMGAQLRRQVIARWDQPDPTP